MEYLTSFLPLILIIFVFYFLLIKPQKKKDKQVQDMRNSLQPGDEIVTIGGIVGKILNVKEDAIVIYCGSDKTKMEFKKWAVSEVTKKTEKPAAPVKEEAAEEEGKKRKIKKLSKKEDNPLEAEKEDNPLETEN